VAERIHVLPRAGLLEQRSINGAQYTDPSILDTEIENVFRRAWVVATPSWRVRELGTFATLKEAGVDVVVTRDHTNTLRAFRNRCLHRGSRLVRGCGHAKRLKCGYHGWTFGLDGTIESVPGAEGFGGADLDKMHLQPVAVREWAGLIWINLSPKPGDFQAGLSGIGAELEPYALDEMEPIQDRVFSIPVNWKSMVENAFDYYHVHNVHRQTIHAHVEDQPELAVYGDHLRQNLHIAPYAWRKLVDRRCSRGGPYSERQVSRLFKYTIFPNTMINVLPYHLTVMRFWPDGVGGTRLHYSFCQRRGARGVEWLRARATWLASRIILAEDVRMLEHCQSGLDSTSVPSHLLHDYEAAASYFHKTLGKWMDGPG
jgi:phenylpropionate dioxygenase-like ring-hydroxylating dioxygenase large terminal subunit